MSRGNLLEPLTGVVSAVFTLSLGVFGLATAVRLTIGLFDPVCFRTGHWPHDAEGRDLAAGVRLDDVDRVTLCVDDPAAWHHVLGFLSDAPTAVAQVGALLLLLSLLRRASRHGVHTPATAADVRRLGHYLIWVLPAACTSVVRAIDPTIAAVTFDAGLASFFGEWDAPWFAVITGIALLSVAKILHDGAEMRADLEGTV